MNYYDLTIDELKNKYDTLTKIMIDLKKTLDEIKWCIDDKSLYKNDWNVIKYPYRKNNNSVINVAINNDNSKFKYSVMVIRIYEDNISNINYLHINDLSQISSYSICTEEEWLEAVDNYNKQISKFNIKLVNIK